MTLHLSENRKYSLTLLLWWLTAAYALALTVHPFLIGCGCAVPEQTCGIVQYYASIGGIVWAVLLPLGMYLFRRRENMLIFLLILAFVALTCTLFLLAAPSLGFSAGDLLSTGMAEFVITLVFTIPLLPYIGFLPLLGAGASMESLLPVLLVYCLAAAGFGVYLYRKRNE